MSNQRNDSHDTFMLMVVFGGLGVAGVVLYFQHILLILGALAVGAGFGYPLAIGVADANQRRGFVGFLEIGFTLLLFRFLFGSPFWFDSWRGIFKYWGYGVQGVSIGFRDNIWVLTIAVTIVSTFIWAIVVHEKVEKSEENQTSSTEAWSEIGELFFFIPKFLGKLAPPQWSAAVSYLGATLGVITLAWVGWYLRDGSIMKSEVILNLAIILGIFSIFRWPMQRALEVEAQRINDLTQANFALEEVRKIERAARDEQERLRREEWKEAELKRDAEYAEATRLSIEKEKLLREAIREAKPGQGKRTDLKPINEKDIHDDDLF